MSNGLHLALRKQPLRFWLTSLTQQKFQSNPDTAGRKTEVFNSKKEHGSMDEKITATSYPEKIENNNNNLKISLLLTKTSSMFHWHLVFYHWQKNLLYSINNLPILVDILPNIHDILLISVIFCSFSSLLTTDEYLDFFSL